MATPRELWRQRRCLGCGACFVAAMLLFHRELSRKAPEPVILQPNSEDVLSHSVFKTTYEMSGNEDRIVTEIMNKVEDITGKSIIIVELVDCQLRLWFATSQYLALTRSVRNFAEDDNFAQGLATPRGREVVFLCYNHTGVTGPALKHLSLHTKPSSPRRIDTADLLIVITKDLKSRASIAERLPDFRNNFKELIHVDGSSKWNSSAPLECIRQ